MVDGILVGISTSILALVIRTRKADCMVLTRIGKTEHYDNADIFNKNCHEFEGIKIIRFLAPLNFINRERFRHVIVNLSGYDPFLEMDVNLKPEIHTIILDCTAISHIDYSGFKELTQLIKGFSAIRIDLKLASLQEPVLRSLLKIKNIDDDLDHLIDEANILPSVHDAVVAVLKSDKNSNSLFLINC